MKLPNSEGDLVEILTGRPVSTVPSFNVRSYVDFPMYEVLYTCRIHSNNGKHSNTEYYKMGL